MSASAGAPSAPATGSGLVSDLARCDNDACAKLVVGGPGVGLCSGCRCAFYCSEACQRAQWKAHKSQCREIRRFAAAEACAVPVLTFALPPFAPLLAAAEAGDANSQYNVSMAYVSGTGVQQSFVSALKWLQRCAAHDSPPREVWADLGIHYHSGRGVAVDNVEAVRLWRVGAAVGDPSAMYNLAIALEEGIGVPVADFGAAVALYSSLAASDDAEALCALAKCYSAGRGVERDVPRAISLFTRAVAHPRARPTTVTSAATHLGVAHVNGLNGTTHDIALGLRYLRQAAAGAGGNETAARVLRELSAKGLR